MATMAELLKQHQQEDRLEGWPLLLVTTDECEFHISMWVPTGSDEAQYMIRLSVGPTALPLRFVRLRFSHLQDMFGIATETIDEICDYLDRVKNDPAKSRQGRILPYRIGGMPFHIIFEVGETQDQAGKKTPVVTINNVVPGLYK